MLRRLLVALTELVDAPSRPPLLSPAPPLSPEERAAKEAQLLLLDSTIDSINDALTLGKAEVMLLHRIIAIASIEPPDARDDAYIEELQRAADTLHTEHERQLLLTAELRSRSSEEELLYLPDDFGKSIGGSA